MTWTIFIQGQVQGVGFRPFVWRAALDRNLSGWVANGLDGVQIQIHAPEQQALDFQSYILKNAPETARITHTALTQNDDEPLFDSFTIRDSNHEGLNVLNITPDAALCPACRQEVHDPAHRRHRYPFTTCTVCGPRYSILEGLPYDRPLTTMQAFVMCDACQSEYERPTDRRYFSQTNSCQVCGVRMQLFHCKTATTTSLESDMKPVLSAWQTGAVVAIKGIGGFLLTCDATNPSAVAALRARKRRPTKPFALMYPDLDSLQGDAEVSEAAQRHLQGTVAPIVLLDALETPRSGVDLAGVAPGLSRIGAMLPNAPLFDLLLRDFGKPIVATSGNISQTPILYEEEAALRDLSDIADCILIHNRRIAMPQDDSVVLVRASGQATWLRRARGLAPAFIQAGLSVPGPTVLAMGAEMKSTFTWAHQGNVHISQYLGDLSDYEVQERFRKVLGQLTGLFKAQPAVVTGDLHPGYFSTACGQMLAEQWQVPWVQVQHHQAHFAAVLAENNLLNTTEPVLGVIWDGTGLGDDGQIWGGEFFCFEGEATKSRRLTRAAHFGYFPFLLGDKMPREPRLSALSICHGLDGAERVLRAKFSETEWKLYQKLPETKLPGCSSVGRMFDAVSSLLGLADRVSYEGEAALLLEDLARRYCKQSGFAFDHACLQGVIAPGSPAIQTQNLFRHLLLDLNAGKDKAYIAAQFHAALIQIIGHIAHHLKIKKIAFSGGVFQNSLLLDMAEDYLSPDYQLFFHQQLSPNDENISFGQWAINCDIGNAT